jgi:hypothetical protein
VDWLPGLTAALALVASASPLTGTLDGLRRLEQAGAGAVVPPSLFEEQVTHKLLETDAELEARDLDVIQAVRAAVGIRVVKVGPFFTPMANMAARMVAVGAGAWFGDDAAPLLAREQGGEDDLPGANVPQVPGA